MQRTPNLGLPQFEPSDKYRLEDYNEAYMKIDEKVKELKDKEAQLDTKLAEAQSIIDTWTQFKANGGEIGGNIVRVNHEKQYDWTFGHSGFTDKSAMISLKDRVTQATIGLNFNLKPGVSSSISPISNGEMDFGLPNYTFKDIYLNGVSKNTNGYTKLPNGIIMQWGENVSIMQGQESKTISFPITFPNHCLGTLSFIKEVVGYVPTKARIASDWNEHSQFRQTITVFGDESVTVYTRFIAFGW